jgi:membrane protease YdiL (CAAX protease family)
MVKKCTAPLIPYLAVAIGLYWNRSAWIAIFGYHLGMMAMVLLMSPRISVNRLCQTNNRFIPFVTAAIGAGSGILLFILWPLLGVPAGTGDYLVSIGLTRAAMPIFMGYYVLVNPFLEEYYWRGFLGGSGDRWIGLNDLLFAGYHVPVLAGKMSLAWLVIIFVILAATAWGWRRLNRLSDGLLPSTLSHTAADFTIISAIYLRTLR